LLHRPFKKSAEKFTEDGDTRIQLLIQHCTAKARAVIKSFRMLDGMLGYEKANELHKERFKEKYVVSKAWIDKLSYRRLLD